MDEDLDPFEEAWKLTPSRDEQALKLNSDFIT
jgi:hypothetical protein